MNLSELPTQQEDGMERLRTEATIKVIGETSNKAKIDVSIKVYDQSEKDASAMLIGVANGALEPAQAQIAE